MNYERIPGYYAGKTSTSPNYIIERSTEPSTLYSFRFSVTGRGHFPLDMLRSDDCHPATAEDYAAIRIGAPYEEVRDTRVVNLRSDQPHRWWTPCFDRWRSFGWIVVTDVEERS